MVTLCEWTGIPDELETSNKGTLKTAYLQKFSKLHSSYSKSNSICVEFVPNLVQPVLVNLDSVTKDMVHGLGSPA